MRVKGIVILVCVKSGTVLKARVEVENGFYNCNFLNCIYVVWRKTCFLRNRITDEHEMLLENKKKTILNCSNWQFNSTVSLWN